MGIYLSKPFYETSEEEESEFSFKKNLEIPDEELNNTKCSCNKNVNSDCNVRITQFTIERHIHDTDRCYVYEVKDRMTNQRFAMKCIITSNENKRKIASNEVKNLMSLQGNKHIVECMHVFHTTDYCLIVEELLEGYLVFLNMSN
ncbi:hypothetical protein MHBO_002197 [Bonamia ostreae]|uniref:Protein kinase domain-containing protein n=1 Tax=Bonamia ostreae TaxID=126728 RepID=A0ABV2AM58_9EUKA